MVEKQGKSELTNPHFHPHGNRLWSKLHHTGCEMKATLYGQVGVSQEIGRSRRSDLHAVTHFDHPMYLELADCT